MQKRLNTQIMEYKSEELDSRFPITFPSHIIRGEVSPDLPHVHNCLEIGYCFEGTGIFTVEDKILPYRSGDAVVINNKELHQAVSSLGNVSTWSFSHLDPVSLLAGHITSEELPVKIELLCGLSFINIIKHEEHLDICTTIKDIILEMRNGEKGFKSIVRSLVFIMLTRLKRIINNSPAGTNKSLKRENLSRISPAIRYIINNFLTTLSISKLASVCYLSEAHFRKLFREATGMSPLQYITKFRMHAASIMLKNTNKQIIRIALDCGYPTLSSFNRNFKEAFAVSPRQYRKSNFN